MNKLTKNQKHVRDWTLQEAEQECSNRQGNCSGCPLRRDGGACRLRYVPRRWDLSNTSDLTPDEISVLRFLLQRGVRYLEYPTHADVLRLWDDEPEGDRMRAFGLLVAELFPSIRPGTSAWIEELMKDA